MTVATKTAALSLILMLAPTTVLADVISVAPAMTESAIKTMPTLDYATTAKVAVKSSFAPTEFSAAAPYRLVDQFGDGYIGTVREFDPVTLDEPTETAVPEPATLILVGSGLALSGIRRRRQR
jgi:hypothetical protein